MNKRNTALLLSLLAMAGALSIPASAEAAGRVRGRAVVHGSQGGHVAATAAAGRGAHGAYARGRQVASDGQGNVQGQSRAAAIGPHGGRLATSSGFTKGADGTFSGGRETSATGANGNSYQGVTSYSNGQFSHSGSCMNAAGEAITCPRGR